MNPVEKLLWMALLAGFLLGAAVAVNVWIVISRRRLEVARRLWSRGRVLSADSPRMIARFSHIPAKDLEEVWRSPEDRISLPVPSTVALRDLDGMPWMRGPLRHFDNCAAMHEKADELTRLEGSER